MGATSKIEWTDASWSPIRARNLATGKIGWHCENVSPGCENCYAEGINGRLGTKLPFKPGHRKDIEIFLDERMLLAPLRWKNPRMIFVASMTSLFADFVKDEWIDRIFAVMALCPQHTFQVLTKRSARMREYISDESAPYRIARRCIDLLPVLPKRFKIDDGWPVESIGDDVDYPEDIKLRNWPLHNCWLGVSTEDQTRADERIPDLLATPAAVRFVSYEPALGPLDLTAIPRRSAEGFMRPLDGRFRTLDWVICGSESGRGARPCNIDWVRSVRDQCSAAGIPFFWKQHAG